MGASIERTLAIFFMTFAVYLLLALACNMSEYMSPKNKDRMINQPVIALCRLVNKFETYIEQHLGVRSVAFGTYFLLAVVILASFPVSRFILKNVFYYAIQTPQ
jgi:hypothetical protein